MAITILPKQDTIAERLGTGLGEGLQLLAQHKMQQLAQRQQQAQAIQPYVNYGYSPEEAAFIQAQPESNRYQAALALAPLELLNQQKAPIQDLFTNLSTGLSESAQSEFRPFLSAREGLLQSLAQLQQPQIPQPIFPQSVQSQSQQSFVEENKAPVTGRELLGRAQQVQAAPTTNLAQQKQIEVANKPYLQNLEKGVALAQESKNIAEQMKVLLDTGKVASGLSGSLTPRLFLNSESQQFEALSNDLASMIASQSGVATNFKLKFAQERKPNLTQKFETQRALIDKILDRSNNVLAEDQFKEELIAANQGYQPRNIQGLVKQKKNQSQSSTEIAPESKQLVKPNESIGKPGESSILQDVGDVVSSTLLSLPLLYALTPTGALTAAVGSSLTGGAVGKAIEKAGGGPLLQFVGSLFGGSGWNKLLKFASRGAIKPNTLATIADEAKKALYKTEEELGKKINVSPISFKKGINEIYNKAKESIALNPTERKSVIEKLSLLEKDVASGKLNAGQLSQRSRELNRWWDQGSKEYRNYIGDIQKLVLNTAKDVGEHHSDWYKTWNAAKDIHQAQNYSSSLSQILTDNPSISKILTNPLARALVGFTAGGGISSPLAGFGGAAVALGAGKAAEIGLAKTDQILGFMQQSPQTRRILAEAVKAAGQRNAPHLIRAFFNLNKKADEYSAQTSE